MNIPVSQRLLACADRIDGGVRVADIGCDHGYLGIYLLHTGKASHVIASDVNQGPLQSAIKNAEKFGVSDGMRFYLSDGVQNIPRDFDVMICAGMGADTMISILEAAPWLKSPQYRLILQCQSKRPELRRYLYAQGYRIVRETLVKEGKFYYPISEVVFAPGAALTPGGYYIPPALVESGSPLLPEFLARVIGGVETAVEGLSRTGGEKYESLKSILQELQELEECL